MQTFSILCENCGDILQDGTPGTIAAYAVTHGDECEGDNRLGPLHTAYSQYLEQLTPEQHMTHTTEQIKHALRKTMGDNQ